MVYSNKGIVSSTQPLANDAGLKILAKGGNCVDACVAVSAALCVMEPGSTGIGGDCYCLYYKNDEKKIYGMNGTGRSASKLSIDYIKKNYPDHILPNFRLQLDSVFNVNVSGAIAGWWDAVEKWGSGNVSFEEILQPAIELAKGAPISQIAAFNWRNLELKFKRQHNSDEDLANMLPSPGFKGPELGQFVSNPFLVKTLETILSKGKKGFYEGDVAELIVNEVQKRGGLISLEDLKNHTTTFVEPICYQVGDHKLWEIPPNGQGLVALLTLGLLKGLDAKGEIKLSEIKHNSLEYLHVLIECLKLSFKDSDEYVNDTDFFKKYAGISQEETIEKLLSPEYFEERSKLFSKDKVIDNSQIKSGVPNAMYKSDTVYFTVSDANGDACSFINSVYQGFGSGILVPGKGFALHNRGGNFSMNPESKNCLEGNKRCYHTIIPGMITTGSDDLFASFGIMGGFNQPQAHVQVFLNMTLFGYNPQEALDSPRITLSPHPDQSSKDSGMGSDGPLSTPVTRVLIEEGVDKEVIEGLIKLGHDVKVVSGDARNNFGRGQVIKKHSLDKLVWAGGSDLRGDGASVPFV